MDFAISSTEDFSAFGFLTGWNFAPAIIRLTLNIEFINWINADIHFFNQNKSFTGQQ